MAEEKKQTIIKQPIIAIDKSMFVLGLLSVLVFISLIQTASLFKLINGKKADVPSVNSASQANGVVKKETSATGSNLPGVLKDIPQQVGGC